MQLGGKCLTDIQRSDVAVFLLANSNKGELKRGILKEEASKWDVCSRTITNIWKMAKTQRELGVSVNVQTKRNGNSNKKRVLPNLELIKSLEIGQRDTIDRLSQNVGASVGTVHSWVMEGLLRAHSSPLHPQLTDSNKLERLKFSLSALTVTQEVLPLPLPASSVTQNSEDVATTSESVTMDPLAARSDPNPVTVRLEPMTEAQQIPRVIHFTDMGNMVHIDEKWFYITTDNRRVYIVPGEELPYRSCKSKRYITKVMFMCAVTRPRYNEAGEMTFDGKIGMWPFTALVLAARRSKNRPAGTLETKSIDSITKQVTKECVINNIIPAIKRLWPEGESKTIFIQQDNARPHIKDSDPEFRAAASSDGFNIQLIFQPPNSPDLNTNDLGFFRALQSLQKKEAAKNVLELVGAVEKAFVDYEPYKLNNMFLTLQSVMVEILKVKGHNNFPIPHMKKGHLAALGILPTNIQVDEQLVRQCIEYLQQLGQTMGLEKLLLDLGYNIDNQQQQ